MRKAAGICLVLLALLPIAAASPLRVTTDKSTYSPGETVTIRIEGQPNTVYGVQVVDPEGAYIGLTEAKADANGVAIVSIGIPSGARLGTYTVYVSGGGETAKATFNVAAPSPAPSPAPAPVTVAPSAAAAVALSSAKTRCLLLLRVITGLSGSLRLLGLEGVLANVTAALKDLNATLQEAEAKMAAGDYSAAGSLASQASSTAGSLIEQAFSLAVGALQSHADCLGNATSDWLVLSLLNITRRLLAEVSPRYIDASLVNVDVSVKVLLAAGRLVNASRLESKVANLTRSLEEAQSLLRVAQERIRVLEGNVTLLRGISEQLQAQLTEARSALSASQSEVQRLSAENERLRARGEELEQQVARLSSQVTTLTALAAAGAAAGFAAGYLLKRRK